jgi:hypothetical protein
MGPQELERLAEVLPALDALEGKARKLAYLHKEVGAGAVHCVLDLKRESRERLAEMADEFSLLEMHELSAIVRSYADDALPEDDESRCPYTDETRA